MHKLFERICSAERKVSCGVLQSVLELAVQIAREGREGRKIGTMFTVGDEGSVLKFSRPLILDPLYGHSHAAKMIDAPEMRETVKELAQLDGAFVVSDQGIVISATRYLEAPSRYARLPLGLGTRHAAAVAMSQHTDAVVVVVSASSVIRVFDDGEIVGEIIPEIWLFDHRNTFIEQPVIEKSHEERIAVLAKK